MIINFLITVNQMKRYGPYFINIFDFLCKENYAIVLIATVIHVFSIIVIVIKSGKSKNSSIEDKKEISKLLYNC